MALAIMVVLLARQNRFLRAELDRALPHPSVGRGFAGDAQRIAPMAVGDRVQPLITFSPPTSVAESIPGSSQPPSGNTLRFTDTQTGTLLFLFGGGCAACDEMDAAVARLVLTANDLGVVVVGIQVDAAKPADLKQSDHGFFVCGVADRHGTWLERVVTVPGLALVDPFGTLRGVWWGVIDDAQELEIHQVMENLAGGNEHRPTP